MRRRIRFAGIVLAGGVAVGMGLGSCDSAGDITERADLVPRTGDVVLRHGAGFWGVLFARLNPRDRRFSHAGVVVRSGGRWQVVHAEAGDLGREGMVRLDTWEAFVSPASRIALLRLTDAAAAGRVADAALAMHRAGLLFDFDFNLLRADAVYCSELVWRALSQGLGRDPLPVKTVLHGREVVLVENLLLDVADLRLVQAIPTAVYGDADIAAPVAVKR